MELWAAFTGLLTQAIDLLTTEVGVSQAIAIILFTLLIRLVLSPISTSAMLHGFKNRQAMAALKPELEKLRAKYKDDPQQAATHTMALYKKHNIKFFDKATLANMSSQTLFGIGMFQVLQKTMFSGKFAWISNIAKPDILLALAVGALTYFSMLLMAGSAEQANTLLLVIPAIISVVVLISAPSALGLYWGTSSAVGVVQSIFVQKYWQRRERGLTGNAS